MSIGKDRTGTIRFIGPTQFASGAWIGVELDEPSMLIVVKGPLFFFLSVFDVMNDASSSAVSFILSCIALGFCYYYYETHSSTVVIDHRHINTQRAKMMVV